MIFLSFYFIGDDSLINVYIEFVFGYFLIILEIKSFYYGDILDFLYSIALWNPLFVFSFDLYNTVANFLRYYFSFYVNICGGCILLSGLSSVVNFFIIFLSFSIISKSFSILLFSFSDKLDIFFFLIIFLISLSASFISLFILFLLLFLIEKSSSLI